MRVADLWDRREPRHKFMVIKRVISKRQIRQLVAGKGTNGQERLFRKSASQARDIFRIPSRATLSTVDEAAIATEEMIARMISVRRIKVVKRARSCERQFISRRSRARISLQPPTHLDYRRSFKRVHVVRAANFTPCRRIKILRQGTKYVRLIRAGTQERTAAATSTPDLSPVSGAR